jgi:hypothetical protein
MMMEWNVASNSKKSYSEVKARTIPVRFGRYMRTLCTDYHCVLHNYPVREAASSAVPEYDDEDVTVEMYTKSVPGENR